MKEKRVYLLSMLGWWNRSLHFFEILKAGDDLSTQSRSIAFK